MAVAGADSCSARDNEACFASSAFDSEGHAMIEQDGMVQTKYGRQQAFAASPDGGDPFSGSILYMDAPGKVKSKGESKC